MELIFDELFLASLEDFAKDEGVSHQELLDRAKLVQAEIKANPDIKADDVIKLLMEKVFGVKDIDLSKMEKISPEESVRIEAELEAFHNKDIKES